MRTAIALGSTLLLLIGATGFADEGGEDLSARLQRYRQGLAPATPMKQGAATPRPLGEPRMASRPETGAAPRELEQPPQLAPIPASDPRSSTVEPPGEPAQSPAPELAGDPSAQPNSRAATGPRRVSVLRKEEGDHETAPNAPAYVAERPRHGGETPARGPAPFAVAPKESDHLEEADSSRRTAALPKASQTPRTSVMKSPKPAAESLFAQRAAALSLETIGPKQLSVGKPATYTLKLQNTGGAIAQEVVVFAAVPDSVEVAELRASSGQARIEAVGQGLAKLQWTMDRLAPQTEEQLTLSLIAKGAGPVTLETGWTCRPGYVQTPLTVVEPKLTVAVSGPASLNFGDTKVYTVTLANPGTGDAENVTLQLVPTSPTQPSAEANRIGILKAGEQKQLELELTAREAGALLIRVHATGEGGLAATADQQVTVRRGRLNIVAQSPALSFAGTVAEYVVKVQNVGDAPVEKIAAAAILPPGAKVAGNVPGVTFDAARGRVAWNVGLLPPSTEKAITIPIQLTQAGTNRLDIQATAGDLTAAGATATEVESLADLKLTVDDPAGPVAVGTETSYTIRLVNRGTKAAERIEVRAIFSEGIEAVNVGGGKADLARNTASFHAIPKIAPGQEVVLTVSGRAFRGGNHVFRTEVDCRDPETKLVSQQTTRFYGGDVPAAASAPPALNPDPRVGIIPGRSMK